MAKISPDNQVKWGTQKWFNNKLETQDIENPSSYYSHGRNGYQKFRHEKLSQIAEKQLRTKNITKILDVGCGTGHLLIAFKKKLRATDAIGFDFLPGLIEIAKKKYSNAKFDVSALPEVPVAANSKDLIIASEVHYYLNKDDQQKTINNIHKALKSDSYFYLTSKIGGQYYSDNDFLPLTKGLFKNVHREQLYNGFYNKLVFPLKAIQLVHQGIKETAIRPGKLGNILRKYPILKTSKLISFLFSIANFFISPLLVNKTLPSVCHSISKLLSFGGNGSNIILIFQKIDKNI